ncbi:H-NS family nucleoid-associated regulatory protein [Massilia sp. TSP1-1-2]|uniref:H-NS family nucleoid-associated regulatory protein n=1 Tax=Massilia sp. TSP1-1-2 TaxID=2804649 RepID=UPI003CE6D41B
MPLNRIFDARGVKPAKPRRERQKYRDPSDPANTWASIGPRPAWFRKALAAGVALDVLRA